MRALLDRKLWQRNSRLCGIDEAGRGPLAGPVVAAAVILPPDCRLRGIEDSKLLAPKERAVLFDRILSCCLDFGVGVVNHRRIDLVNIRIAAFEAMKQALAKIAVPPDYTIVDGFRIPGLKLPHEGVVGGDGKSVTIAAASILAKVTRDRIMDKMHDIYPDYGFIRNKGYGTPEHLAALAEFGPSPIHRHSFAPVREAQQQAPSLKPQAVGSEQV